MTARFISFHKITKVVKSLVRQYQIIKIPFSFLHHQLKIQDVHLRFEDDSSNLENPFSFGVCINNVSAQNPAKEMVSVDTNRIYNCPGQSTFFISYKSKQYGVFGLGKFKPF